MLFAQVDKLEFDLQQILASFSVGFVEISALDSVVRRPFLFRHRREEPQSRVMRECKQTKGANDFETRSLAEFMSMFRFTFWF
jgi:hypothetical protein